MLNLQGNSSLDE